MTFINATYRAKIARMGRRLRALGITPTPKPEHLQADPAIEMLAHLVGRPAAAAYRSQREAFARMRGGAR